VLTYVLYKLIVFQTHRDAFIQKIVSIPFTFSCKSCFKNFSNEFHIKKFTGIITKLTTGNRYSSKKRSVFQEKYIKLVCITNTT